MILPSGWIAAPLQALAVDEPSAITDGPFGSNLKTQHYTSSGPRVIRLQNIGDGDFIDQKAHISEAHYLTLSRHQARSGDLVVAMLGDRLPRACMVPADLGPAIVKADCARMRPHWGLNSRYLLYALNSDPVRSQCEVHGVGRPRLKLSEIRQLIVPVAPRAEQDRIVSEIDKHFSRLDAAVAALKRAQANLRRYRAAVLQAAVEGRLVATEAVIAQDQGRSFESGRELLERVWKERGAAPSDHPASGLLPFTPPPGWAVTALASVAALKGGITKGQQRTGAERLREVPYLRVANVQRGFLDLRVVKAIEATDDEIEELRLQTGDVLFNEGGDRDKLGRGWVWAGEIAECIHQNHVFRARLAKGLNPKFISWYANSVGQDYFNREGKQTTNLASINLTKLARFPIPVPPTAEQDRIVQEVERLLSDCDSIEGTIHHGLVRAQRLRAATLSAAFSGRLVPLDPHDEPASALLERIRAERHATTTTRKPTARRKPDLAAV